MPSVRESRTMSPSSIELLTSSDPQSPNGLSESASLASSPLASTRRRNNSSRHIVINRGGTHTVGVAELGLERLQQIHDAPGLLFGSTLDWLKQTPDRRAALIRFEFGCQRMDGFLKETRTKSWRVRFVAHLSSCRVANAFQKGHALRTQQICTPRPLAYFTLTKQGVFHEYLLTEVVPDSVSLSSWLIQTSLKKSREFWAQRCNLSRELASQIRRLHQHRFDHRDLKASNVLVSNSGARPQPWLIDLDGVWQWPILPRVRVIQNLARLWVGVTMTNEVTATDALRFLKSYMGRDFLKSWRPLWRSISRRAAAKMIEIRRREISTTKIGSQLSAALESSQPTCDKSASQFSSSQFEA